MFPFAASEQQKQKQRNRMKLQLPGYVTRQNTLTVQPVSTNEKIPPLATAVVTSSSKAVGKSIRRIRRPQQWIYPTAAETEAAANDKVMMRQQQELLSSSQYVPPCSLYDKCKNFIIEFLQGSSIHGFVYLAKFGLNIIER